MTTTETDTTTPSAILIDAAAIGALMGISGRSVRRLNDAGRLPRSIPVGPRMLRWRRAEILAWIDADCPNRKTWDAARKKPHTSGERA